MAFTNFDTKEIHAKVIYLGAPSSGKTENLRSIFSQTSPEMRGGILELAPEAQTPAYFDFLPLSLGQVNNFHVKLHLFTLPTNRLFETTVAVMLRGVDGCVFVADSRLESLAENLEYYNRSRALLRNEGYNLSELPYVIQFNKRDLVGTVPVDILRKAFNTTGFADHEAVASKSVGTMETLESMSKLVLNNLSYKAPQPP